MITMFILIVLCILLIWRFKICTGTFFSGIAIIIFSFLSPLGHVQLLLLEVGGMVLIIGAFLHVAKKLTGG